MIQKLGLAGNTIKNLINDLDKLFSFLCILLAVLLIALSFFRGRPNYIVFGVILLFVCLLYLKIRNIKISFTFTREINYSAYLILNILFFLAIFFCTLILYNNPIIYVRPISYFILIIFMVVLLTIEIIHLPKNKNYSSFILLKIIFVSLNLACSQLFLYPTLIGDDPWVHQKFTYDILKLGFIPEGFGYSKLPIMHLIIAIFSSLTGLDYKEATFYAISCMHVICLTFTVFLLGKFLFNSQTGLLAALFLGISMHFIRMSYWTIPNTLGGIYIPIIIYLLYKLKQDNQVVSFILAFIFMLVLILTHPLASMCLAILLIAFWVGSLIYKKLNEQHDNSYIKISIILLFVVGMLSWWMYASGHITVLAELIKWGFSVDYFMSKEKPNMIGLYSHDVGSVEAFFNEIAKFLFWGISLIACFYTFSKSGRNQFRFTIAMGSLSILALVFFSTVFYLGGILIDRWFYFVEILLSIFFAAALFIIFLAYKRGFTIVLILVPVYSFFMIMNPYGNMDNPLFKNTNIRKAYTSSEMQTFKTTLEITTKKIGIDMGPAEHLNSLGQFPKNRIVSISDALFKRNYIKYQDYIIIIRKEIIENTIAMSGEKYVKLNYDPGQLLARDRFSCIYQSGSTDAFTKT